MVDKVSEPKTPGTPKTYSSIRTIDKSDISQYGQIRSEVKRNAGGLNAKHMALLGLTKRHSHLTTGKALELVDRVLESNKKSVKLIL